MQVIRKENDKLKTRINKVLELASLETKKQALEFTTVDVHVLLRDLLQEMAVEFERARAEIIFYERAEHRMIEADETHLKNAFRNLLENALKYTNQTPQIELITVNSDGYLRIDFKDNGIGIQQADQVRIFDKFYRVSTGDLHTVKGFGLGLNYVRQIVHAHRGDIAVGSKVGEGSTFTVRIPLRAVST